MSLCLGLTSCGLIKKSTKENINITSTNTSGMDSISASNNGGGSTEHRVEVTADDIVVGSSSTFGDSYIEQQQQQVRIIEVKNTKVIKQSSDLAEGRIVYKIPDKMKVRSTYTVLVRISKSKNVLSIYDSLKGTIMASNIPVTETMEVKLIDLSPPDNKAFEIVDGNSGVQMVEDGDTYTEWSWAVTPVRVGNSKLKIVVSVIRGDNKKDIVYEDTVEVDKDIITQVLFFLKKYWQVLMTSIAIPFIVWIYKSRKKKKEDSKEEKE